MVGPHQIARTTWRLYWVDFCPHSQKGHRLDANCGFHRVDASLSSLSCIRPVGSIKFHQHVVICSGEASPTFGHANANFSVLLTL